MVRTLYERNGGQEPELGNLVRDVEADQEIEIKRMQGLLALSADRNSAGS